MNEDHLYSIKEAAHYLGIPASSLARKVTKGEAPHRRVFRHVRFSTEDLQALQQPRGQR